MRAIINPFLMCLGTQLLFLELLVSAAEVLPTEDFGINSKTFITPTSSIPSRKYDNEQLLDINFYSKTSQSSQKSSTTTTTTKQHQLTTTSLNANNNNKQDNLALVTPVIMNKNRKDSNDGGNSKPIIIYNIYKNITLNCELPNTAASDIEWERNGTLVENVKSIKGRYKINDSKFQIDKALLEDADLYSCVSKSNRVEIRKDFIVAAQVEVRVPSNLGVVEGESLRIQCTVIGTRPHITWEHGNLTLTQSTEKYELREDENKIANAILEIKNASLADRGEYKCIGKNEDAEKAIGAKGAEDTSMVRVKGKLAALWPFLGICAEVFILCTIILIYEKKRNKTDLDESDTDPNTEQKKKRRNYD